MGEKQAASVAPRAGAWIETTTAVDIATDALVAPRAGAWIETLSYPYEKYGEFGRAPRGRVD